MKKIIIITLVIVTLIFAASCQPARIQTTPTGANLLTQTSAKTQTAAQGTPVDNRLIIWDTFTDENQNNAMEALIAVFTEQNPDIIIKREAKSVEDMRALVKPSLAMEGGPDIVYADLDLNMLNDLAQNEILLPLDDAYQENGWNNRIYSWVKDRISYKGKVYGIGNNLEFAGVYYNAQVLYNLGIAVPKTYQEFLDMCGKIKEAGYIPAALAGDSKIADRYLFSIFANNIAGKDKLESVLFGDGVWRDPDFTQAAQSAFVEMKDAGCFADSTAELSTRDGNVVFPAGKVVMDIGSSLYSNDINDSVKDFEAGWFFFPAGEGKSLLPPATIKSAYLVSAKTRHSKEAVKFLDFLFSQQALPTWMKDMKIIPPVSIDFKGNSSTNLEIPSLLKIIAQDGAEITPGYLFESYVPESVKSVMSDEFQTIPTGKNSSEKVMVDIQKAWLRAILIKEILR